MNSKHIKRNVDYDEREFEQVLSENIGMIKSLISKLELECGHFKVCWEDLYQEGLIALYNAYANYKKDSNCKFSTFAYMVVNRSLKRYHYQQMTKYNKECYSLDNVELYDHRTLISDNVVGDHDLKYTTQDKRDKIDKLFMVLNNEDQQIVALRANNNTYKEIAKKLNISYKRVDNRLLRIKDRFVKNNMVAC